MRRAASSLEAIVAFTLLTSVLSLSLPLVVRHGRMLMEQRAYRIALDEVSNQMDRLTSLPENELPAALAAIRPSEFAAARLPGIQLNGTLQPADIGGRVTMRLSWGQPLQREVRLAAWIASTSQQTTQEPSPDLP